MRGNSSPRRLYQTELRQVPFSLRAKVSPARSELTLIDYIDVSHLRSVPAHDRVNVGLHDALEIGCVGDILHPHRELRVPDEGVTTNDRAGLFGLGKDLVSSSLS
jgi:hypothetical protein